MDEKPNPLAELWKEGAKAEPAVKAGATDQSAVARGSGHISQPPPIPNQAARERSEHSVMEGLPDWKADRIAGMRRELADLQQQLIASQQRIQTELQGRADDADRFEALEARLQEQEAKSQQDATRAKELDIEITSLRVQLGSLGTTVEEVRKELAARDMQLEDARKQHRDLTQQFEAQLQDAKKLIETRDAELATRTSERETEQTTRTRLEQELEAQRGKLKELSDQLELQFASLRDAQALAATRDTDLTTITTERDALKTELETVRRDLDAARIKARDVGTELMRIGQDVIDGVGVIRARAEKSQPPPVPTRQPETILEVTEEPKGSRIGSVLLILAGVILGCGVTIAIAKASNTGSSAAAYQNDVPAPSAAAVEPQPAVEQPVVEQPVIDPAPPAETSVSARPNLETAPRPSVQTTDGVIVLPKDADGHRVFVDGQVVDINRSRAVVACGTREVRIGSRGTARKFDVECGGETAIPPDTRTR
jgi:hypothetical protein